MAGVRVRPSQIVFAVLLASGCVAFAKRKDLMPEVFERNKKLKEESFQAAAEFREIVKKRMKNEQDN